MRGAQGERRDLTQVRCPPTRAPVLTFVSAPIDIHLACFHRIGWNGLGAEGGKAVAAVLKDTQISNLK